MVVECTSLVGYRLNTKKNCKEIFSVIMLVIPLLWLLWRYKYICINMQIIALMFWEAPSVASQMPFLIKVNQDSLE